MELENTEILIASDFYWEIFTRKINNNVAVEVNFLPIGFWVELNGVIDNEEI